MVDPTERDNKIVEEEKNRLRGLIKDYEPQVPTHSRQAVEMTRDEERQDYRMTKGTEGGFAMRLKEGKAKFGTKRAVTDILDWAIRNERA